MSQTRKRRDGTITIANTVYIPKKADDYYRSMARNARKSKSFVMVEVLVNGALKQV